MGRPGRVGRHLQPGLLLLIRKDWGRWAASGLTALLGLILFHFLQFSDEANNSLCFSRRFLHFSCPGCGLTRAFGALADFRFNAAFVYHPLAPVFLAEGILLWIGWGLVIARILPCSVQPLGQPLVVCSAVSAARGLRRAASDGHTAESSLYRAAERSVFCGAEPGRRGYEQSRFVGW